MQPSCDSTLLLIRDFPLFNYMTDADYDDLTVIHNFITAPKGSNIYFPAQHRNKIYFAKEGFIKIGYVDADGNEVIKEIIQKGEFFGQLTLEKNNANDEFAQACRTDVSLCAFNIEDFYRLLQRKPDMALSYTTHLGSKLKKVESRLLGLINKDVRGRIIQFFMQLIEEGVLVVNNTAKVERFLSHDELARLIGASRQTVTTLLNQLQKEGLLDVNHQYFLIPDVGKFKKQLVSGY